MTETELEKQWEELKQDPARLEKIAVLFGWTLKEAMLATEYLHKIDTSVV